MIKIAEKLSSETPDVRVDLYTLQCKDLFLRINILSF